MTQTCISNATRKSQFPILLSPRPPTIGLKNQLMLLYFKRQELLFIEFINDSFEKAKPRPHLFLRILQMVKSDLLKQSLVKVTP
jgi:hypothetical protein